MDTDIAKIGDVIKWQIDNDRIIDRYKKDTFEAEVAMVNHEEKYYGVYCEYGQDHIPFNQCEIIKKG